MGRRYYATITVTSTLKPTLSYRASSVIIGIGPQFSKNIIQGVTRSVSFYDPIILELIPELGSTSFASSWSCAPAPCLGFGICSAILSFPIYMMVSSLFRSIESDSLWMNQRAARVQKVKEDAALNLASSMLAQSSSQAGPVRSSSAADDFVPPPPNQRPAFVRTAANSRPSALSRASQVMKSPNAALPDITSLTSAKLPAASAKVQRPRPSKSTLTAIASIHYLSRPSTASPASLRTQALNFSVPAPSGAAPAAAAIRTLGARLALKQATQKHTDIPAPSSGVPRPLLSPTLRRVLYSTSSIKSTSTSTFAPPPAGVTSHQRNRISHRVGDYLPRRALPTISDTLRPSLMMQTEMELTEIGTKQAVSQGLRSKSLGQRVFDFLKARSLSMARKQLPPKFISVIYSVFGMGCSHTLLFWNHLGEYHHSVARSHWSFCIFKPIFAARSKGCSTNDA